MKTEVSDSHGPD